MFDKYFINKFDKLIQQNTVSGESYNLDSAEEIVARLGSDVSLYCRLRGNVPVRWERPDGQPLRARQISGDLLKIQRLQPQDAGVYLCIRGENTQVLRIEVDSAGM